MVMRVRAHIYKVSELCCGRCDIHNRSSQKTDLRWCSCRYYTGEGWVPKKLDVLVEAPDSLDLEHLRATGLQPG